MKLYNILFVIDRGSVEGALDAIEFSILPDIGIIAHHLPVSATDDDLGGPHSSVVDDRVVEGEDLEDLLGFSVEEMYAAVKGDLVVPEEVEEGAMVGECAFLTIRHYSLQDGVSTVSMVF